MKGNAKLIETLNALLADELGAINQYIVHAEMCENWGYGKLHDHFEKRAITDSVSGRHADRQQDEPDSYRQRCAENVPVRP